MKSKLAIFIPELVSKDKIRKGYQKIFYNEIEYLSQNFDINIYTFKIESNFNLNNIKITKLPSNIILTIVGLMLSLLFKKPIRACRSWYFNFFFDTNEFNQNKFDLYYFYTSRMAYFLNKNNLAKSIINSIDPYPIFMRELSNNSNIILKFVFYIEFILGLNGDKKLTRYSKNFLLLNERDIKRYKKFYKISSIFKGLYSVNKPPINYDIINNNKYISLIGNFNYIPNYKGLIFFLENVLPKLPKHYKICIAGSGLEKFKDELRVDLVFSPPSFHEVISNSWITLSLSDVGVGIQSKVIDSLSYGVPVLSYVKSVKGMTSLKDSGIILFYDLNAQVIIKEIEFFYLNKNILTNLSIQALQYIEKNHSIKLINNYLHKLLQKSYD
jgi:hypothetical protein